MASKNTQEVPLRKDYIKKAYNVLFKQLRLTLKTDTRQESLDDIGSLMLNGQVKLEGAKWRCSTEELSILMILHRLRVTFA